MPYSTTKGAESCIIPTLELQSRGGVRHEHKMWYSVDAVVDENIGCGENTEKRHQIKLEMSKASPPQLLGSLLFTVIIHGTSWPSFW